MSYGGVMSPRLAKVPDIVLEVLRFAVVVAGAAAGFEIGRRLADDGQTVLGAFSAPAIGAVIGAGLGYSLGGVLARMTIRAIDSGERALDGMAPDEVVAGTLGSLLAVALVALLAWPVLLLDPLPVMVPVFMFVLLVAALFGFRAGRNRRQAVSDVVGQKAGLAARQPGASATPAGARHVGGHRRPDHRGGPRRVPAWARPGADAGAHRAAGPGRRR